MSNYEQFCFFAGRIVSLMDFTTPNGGGITAPSPSFRAPFLGRNGKPAMAAVDNLSARPRVRLLVVDDDASIREVSAAVLTEEGYHVLTANDGMHALEVLPQFGPDLVITDLRMPRMTGFELLTVIRERFPRLPVIAVSGDFCGEEMPSGLIADAFVSKGCSYMTSLESKITELLSASPI